MSLFDCYLVGSPASCLNFDCADKVGLEIKSRRQTLWLKMGVKSTSSPLFFLLLLSSPNIRNFFKRTLYEASVPTSKPQLIPKETVEDIAE